LGILLFLFGIVFRNLEDTYAELKPLGYFQTVATSMWTLLVHGVFLDEVSGVLNEIQEVSVWVTLCFLIFIFLGTFTVLNMLIGIVCEVVGQISEEEKENAEVEFLRTNLMDILSFYDKDGDELIARDEFELLLQDETLIFALKRFGGSDVNELRSMVLDIYEDRAEKCIRELQKKKQVDSKIEPFVRQVTDGNEMPRLSFTEIIQVVLRLRGGEVCRVTDVIDLREYLRERFDILENANEVRAQQILDDHGSVVKSRPSSVAGKAFEVRSPRPAARLPSKSTPTVEIAPPSWALELISSVKELAENVFELRNEQVLLGERMDRMQALR